MSIAAKCKELEATNGVQLEQIAALETDLRATKEQAEALAAQVALSENAQKLAAEGHALALEAAMEEKAQAEAKAAEIQAQADATAAELDKAKAALANPAFADAAATGQAEPVSMAGDGDGAGEPKVNHYGVYVGIASPKAKTVYFREHKAEIQADYAEWQAMQDSNKSE